MKILHLVASVDTGSYGIGSVVLNYVAEQNLLGEEADIWCFDDRDCLWEISGRYEMNSRNMHSFPLRGPRFLSFSPSMEWAALRCASGGYEIIHQHSLWSGVSRVSRLFQMRHSASSVISPHGCLEKWALQRSAGKKKVALALFERGNLRSASCLHACSAAEADSFREFGLSNPIAVIPNGIGVSWIQSRGEATAFRKRFGIPDSMRILLYLARITPIKGLPMLMEAMGSIRRHLSDWVLVVAGPNEFGHLAEVRRAVSRNGLDDRVMFTGLLKDQGKRDAFAAAELFILPTLREAAPVAILEALGAGVPVVTTKGAPWHDLETYGCGWWTEISAGGLAASLEAAMAKTPEELKAMGARGRKLVASRYTWGQSARMTLELYGWLLGRRQKPGFVAVD